MSGEKKKPKELPSEQKIIIMQKLLPVAKNLFEKWNNELDRSTQHNTWNSVAKDCEMEGIYVGGGIALKNCVRNWINRVEGMLQSGGHKKEFTPLQKLCIDLINAAKGGDVPSLSFMADNDHNNNSDSQPLTYELAIQPTFFEFDDNNRETKLKQYNLLLQNIEIEKRLGLNHQEIQLLRQSICHSLCDLPSSASIEIERMAHECSDTEID